MKQNSSWEAFSCKADLPLINWLKTSTILGFPVCFRAVDMLLASHGEIFESGFNAADGTRAGLTTAAAEEEKINFL